MVKTKFLLSTFIFYFYKNNMATVILTINRKEHNNLEMI
jgi:hypothetical protein